MQSCGILLSSAGKIRTSLITGFNKHESRLLYAVIFFLHFFIFIFKITLLELFLWEENISEFSEQEN